MEKYEIHRYSGEIHKEIRAIRRSILDRKEEEKSGKVQKGTKKRHLTNLKGHGHFFEELVLELEIKEHVGISHIDKGVSGGGGNI